MAATCLTTLSNEGQNEEYIPGCFCPLSKDNLCYILNSVNENLPLTDNQNTEEFNDLKRYLAVLSLPPMFTTVRVNLEKITLSSALEILSIHLNGKIRNIERLEFTIYPHPVIPDMIIIESHDRKNIVPKEKEIIVGQMCGSAVLRGADVYAPGVLGATPDLCEREKVAVFVDLENRCLRGSKVYRGQKMFIGNGTALIGRSDLFRVAKPLGRAVMMDEKIFDSPCLGNFRSDLFFLQNLPSVICSHILKPKRSEIVLDMCGAPGGKATHLASLVGNCGRVIAIDRSKRKIEQINENAKKLGLGNIYSFVHDSTRLVDENLHSEPNRSDELFECEEQFCLKAACSPPPYAPSSFKWIMLDAPCSALGQRPQIQTSCSYKELKSFPVIQRKLLGNAVKLLKPGGTLVYSTCSIVPEENEKNVKWVLDSFQNIELLDSDPKIGRPGLLNCGLSSDQCKKVQRFGPLIGEVEDACVTNNEYDRDTIGFFISVFRKM